ncbi:cytochrome P450 2F3-like isoform X2 [Rhinoderma darwinii]|uniref:cytochrome P450 2F3-like isoform X2 n=1 Tax=Rhinoderma darwinii TaxID=43563 RepID=UPI003F663710
MDLSGFLILFLLLLVTLLYLSQWKLRGKLPPGPTPLPFVGNMHQVKMNDLIKSLVELSNKYGPMYTFYLGSRPTIVLCGYQVLKEALVDHAEEFSGRGEFPAVQMYSKGNGIVYGTGERWRQLRRFAITTLKNFGMGKRSLEERVKEEAQYLLAEFRKSGGKPLDPTFGFSSAGSNIICSLVFGERFDYRDEEFTTLLYLINNSWHLMSSTWGQLLFVFPKIMKHIPGPHRKIYKNYLKLGAFVAKRLQMNKETFDPNNPRDFIDCFLIKIEQGLNIMPLICTSQYDPTKFKNPNSFDPTHFLDENGLFKKNEGFMAFSAGKRVCLGEGLALMELFIFFTTILQNFNPKPLVDPKDIDITPESSGLGNLPRPYKICLLPR